MDKTAIRTRTGKAVLLAGLCFSALLANAGTVSVDCDAGNTIQAALGNVKPGGTVLVSGTCKEQVSFNSELVRITLDGQKKTTIQHPGKGAPSPHTVFIRGKDIFIKGITVIGGLDGIHLAGPASAELDGNVVLKAARAGIHADKGSIVRILKIPRLPALSPNTSSPGSRARRRSSMGASIASSGRPVRSFYG